MANEMGEREGRERVEKRMSEIQEKSGERMGGVEGEVFVSGKKK